MDSVFFAGIRLSPPINQDNLMLQQKKPVVKYYYFDVRIVEFVMRKIDDVNSNGKEQFI